jgi:hypothetical protein
MPVDLGRKILKAKAVFGTEPCSAYGAVGFKGRGGSLGCVGPMQTMSWALRIMALFGVACSCALCCYYCRLELRAGELPASFELDERSHPLLTDDLLHLVHGRTLLGAVQLPHTLRLEGEHTAAPGAGGLRGCFSVGLPGQAVATGTEPACP